MQAAKNPKVRRKEISADVFPSENAVNIDEANILKPVKRKVMANLAQPSFTICHTLLPDFAKMPIKGSLNALLRTNHKTELAPIKNRLTLIICFSAGISCLP